ncbi:MAG TPA: hypothetical protein VK082_03325 [Paenalcaligenes sp.]|nr:hypothetical protein [Paenalcaligenes sp.]
MVESSIVRLYDIAHARAGDKGNRLNISVILFDEKYWPAVCEQLTAERVNGHFSFRGAVTTKRYLLPNLYAMNFVMDNVLEGGVNSSLNLDSHGKTLSFYLLEMPIDLSNIKTEQ